MHLSDAIHSLGEALFHSQAHSATVDDETRMQWEKGYLWEEALSLAFGEKAAIRPGEVELDGIIGSPDGINFDEDGVMYAEEYKCTAFSSNKPITDVWKWMMQAKGYCKMLGVDKCVFRVFHIRGDYTNMVPVYKVWELTFTQAELDENWGSILAQAKVMEVR